MNILPTTIILYCYGSLGAQRKSRTFKHKFLRLAALPVCIFEHIRAELISLPTQQRYTIYNIVFIEYSTRVYFPRRALSSSGCGRRIRTSSRGYEPRVLPLHHLRHIKEKLFFSMFHYHFLIINWVFIIFTLIKK